MHEAQSIYVCENWRRKISKNEKLCNNAFVKRLALVQRSYATKYTIPNTTTASHALPISVGGIYRGNIRLLPGNGLIRDGNL